jgi:hypothetical protein
MPIAALPYLLGGIQMFGGLFGGKKKKYVDPEYLRQKYGPEAIARDTQTIANNILNSPYGQQLMAQAGISGQQLQSNLASNAAASGMGNGSGASSGASDFAAATAPQAQGSLESQTKAGVWQAALPQAAALNNNLMGVAERGQEYNNANQQPSFFQKLAAGAGQWASTLGANARPAPTSLALEAAPTDNPYGIARTKKPGELQENRA